MKTQFFSLATFNLLFMLSAITAQGQYPQHKKNVNATGKDSLPDLQRNLDKDPDAARLLKEANAADFIVEGELVSQRYYRDKEQPETYQYQVNTFKILKIFKGNLECGTIEVLSKGLVGLGGSFMIPIDGTGDISFGKNNKYEVLFLKKDLSDYYNSPDDQIQSSNVYRTRTDFVYLYFEQAMNEVRIAARYKDLSKSRYYDSYKVFRHYFDSYIELQAKVCYISPFDWQLINGYPNTNFKKKGN